MLGFVINILLPADGLENPGVGSFLVLEGFQCFLWTSFLTVGKFDVVHILGSHPAKYHSRKATNRLLNKP